MSRPAAPDGGGDPSLSSFSDVQRSGPLDAEVAVGLLQRGQTLADQGDWELAATTFARVVGNADPAVHTAALLGLAECRYRLDDEPAALQAWITATQAPENPLTWRAWKAIAAARVRSGDVPGAARAYREAARRAPASEQPEIQSRIGWLTKELGDESASRRAFSRSRTRDLPQPSVTYAIMALTAALSLGALFASPELRGWLLLDKGAIYLDGEYWRLFTVTLVHGSILHLAFNLYALWIIGPIVEALYGPVRFLSIYLLCAAAGSAASYMTSATPSVGASGAVFGLFGVLLVADRVHKPALTRNARNITMQIGVLIVINLVIGFSLPGIDNAAHVGGLMAGAWLGLVLVPRGARLASFWTRPASPGQTGGSDEAERRGRWLALGGVTALVGVVVALVAISPVTYDPRIFFFMGGQLVPVTVAAGDAVRVAPGLAGWLALVAVPGRRLPVAGRPPLQGQLDRHRAAGLRSGSLVAQPEAPPDGEAAGQEEPLVERAASDGILPPERVAALVDRGDLAGIR